ncbi:hypothetical protein J5N97_012085 [Dioscorea zingiberensis]|uniref:Uncharacterized protein n=1 Tax=Dioscorea zingiberensis TaxID=325984 RepID=A0A9D5CNC0_9LILI|nr:hypothetical protein J5N97_012085 [Dioscorea zingiberensis]
MYPVETTDIRLNAYWSSGTDLQPYNILKLETNGSMVLISSNQTTTKNLTLSSGSNPGLVYRGRIGPEGKNMELEVEVEEIILLSEWVYSCYLVGELKKLILDEDNVDMVEFENMVKVGLWCIQTDPTLRPSMKNVITMLEGCGGIPSPPPP